MASSKTSLTGKGILGFFWNFSGSVVQIILQLVVIGVLSRLLTPEEFGVVAIIMIMVNFTNLFSTMGVSSAVIQLPNLTARHVSLAYTLATLLGVILGAIYYLLTPWFANFFDIREDIDALRFFALFFPLVSFRSVGGALLNRKLMFDVGVKIGLISYVIGSGIISIAMAYMGYGYWALIWGQFVALCVTVSLTIYYEFPKFSFKLDKKALKELLFFGSGHTLGTIFNYFAENADNIVVGRTLSTYALGYYSKAFQLLAIPAKFFGSIFDNVLFPILSKKQDQTHKLGEFYLFSTSVCFGVLVPMSIVIFVNAELLVDTLLGSQWDKVVLPLQLLIFGLAFRFGTKINKSYLKSLGIVYRGAYYQLIFAVLMIASTYVGGKLYGLPGVALGVLIATVLNYAQVTYRLYLHLGFSGKRLSSIFIKSVVPHLIFIGATVLLYNFGITSKWVHLLLSILIYLPLMLFYFFNQRNVIFNSQNFGMISMILNAMPSRVKLISDKFDFFKKYNA